MTLNSSVARLVFASFWPLAATLFLTSCATAPLQNMVIGPDYQPTNVFRLSPRLPSELRRVAVLPLTSDDGLRDAVAGQQALEPVLQTELLKTKRFEIIWVAPEALRQWTGQKSWKPEDRLPPRFLEKLRGELGCDGVLFCHLTRFQAYPPLAIGWKLRLVEGSQSQTLWAADEVFDAGEPAVANSARRYQQQHNRTGPPGDFGMILSSPRRFGHYTACALLGTLPER